ncbi:MAG TPA: hypothetical protein VFZ66_24455 [Herpetosiphonaceae bacterium]
MTDQKEDTDSIDPFQCLPPTRKNFPSTVHALTYYEARAKKAREAQRLLAHGSVLARTVVEHAQAAAFQVRSLSRVELLKLGVTEETIAELQKLTDAPEQLGAALVPMVETFSKAAALYDERAKILEQACAALIAQAQREGALS